jgi:hypothetical protein
MERQNSSRICALVLLVVGASSRAPLMMILYHPIFAEPHLLDYALAAHNILRLNSHALGQGVPLLRRHNVVTNVTTE